MRHRTCRHVSAPQRETARLCFSAKPARFRNLPHETQSPENRVFYNVKSDVEYNRYGKNRQDGKSTTCANLAFELTSAGKKVLLIDGDMQLNLSLSFFDEERVLEMAECEENLYYAIKNKRDLSGYIVHTPYENLDLIPSSTLMSQIEYELFTMIQREYVLKKCLRSIYEKELYDYVLIDAPPTLGTWVINILCAADYVIVPVEASPWGLFGLANMFDFLNGISEMTEAKIMGVLITKVDERKNYYKQTREILAGYDNINVFETFIHVDTSVEWAQDNSVPVSVYKKSTRSAKEFQQLAREVMDYGSR